ncbi:programmed cell death 6-interacting protein-like isoform X2 [Convolutriloba macropyga]|uniref:programmed cell death 6-interacting protein-like isoform X2 n=1 Tax=Convolutriloba macropyga TaxID=536237 RepID=UPI003F51F7D9
MAKSLKGIPLKTTSEIDFAKLLKSHVRSSGTSEEDAIHALATLTKSRNTAVLVFPDRTEVGLNILQRYYDQFSSMEKRFPITDNNEIRVSFMWRDSFGKGVFGAKKSLSNSGFEKAAVLYDVAAFMSQIAAGIRSTDDASMQTATKFYQQAAGIFEYLRDHGAAMVGQVSTNDLSSEFLSFLVAFCQAQAQECIWIKAYISGKMKPKVLSQVTAGVADLYETAHSKAESQRAVSSVLKDDFNWLPDVVVKIDHYKALSHYYLGKELKRVRDSPGAECKYGEEIARYQMADTFLKHKITMDLLPNNLKNDLKSELNVAVKDNNLIYHEPIPDTKTLSAPEKTILAKPTSFDAAKQLSKDSKDIFGAITPLAVTSAMEFFKQKKTELVSVEVAKLREANDTLNGVLASLNLPAALEETRSGELPASLWEKASKLQSQGGIDNVTRRITDLPELLERNKEILDESVRLLREEREQDEKLRNQYKQKWNRTPSEQLTKQLTDDQTKYLALLQRSKEADIKVKTQFENTIDYMRILSLSKAEIEGKLPSSQSNDATRSPEAQQLRELMKEVDAIKVQRSRIEEKLQAKTDTATIKAKFLGEMTPSGSVEAASVTETLLNEMLGDARTDLGETFMKQEQLLEQIQTVHSRFAQFSSGNNEVRDEFLKKLAQAYDAYETLVNHLGEGQKFYGDLTEILLTHQSKVNDFVFARSTEKEDLLKDITSNATKTSGQPNTPSYHANIPATTTTTASGPTLTTTAPAATAPASSAPMGQNTNPFVQQPAYANPSAPAAAPAPMPAYNPYMPMTHQMYANPYGGGGYTAPPPYGQMPPPQAGGYPYPQHQPMMPPYGQPPHPYQQAPHPYGAYPYSQPPPPGGVNPWPAAAYPQQQPQQ